MQYWTPNSAHQRPPVVKLCVIMDLTASMHAWLAAAKTEAVRVVHQMRQEHHDKELQVAFVGYRDFCDGPNRLCSVDFTTDLQPFEEALRRQQAYGGGDTAEDVAGALHKAVYDLDWSNSVAQIMVLVADAPPHGHQWHSENVTDDYPDCELDLVPIAASMGRFMNFNSNPSVTFLHLTELTNELEDWLQDCTTRLRGVNRFVSLDVSEQHEEASVSAASFAIGLSLHAAVTQSLSFMEELSDPCE